MIYGISLSFSESEAIKRGTGVQRSQSCLEIKLPKTGKNKDQTESVRNGIVITDSSSETSVNDKLKEKQVDSRTVARTQSAIEIKTGTGKGLANGVTPSIKEQTVDETKVDASKHIGKGLENSDTPSVKRHETIKVNKVGGEERNTSQSDIKKNEIKTIVTPTVRRSRSEDGRRLNRIQSGISGRNQEVDDHKSQNRIQITGDRNKELVANGPVVVVEQLNVQQSPVLKKEVDNSSDKRHSRHIHSRNKHTNSKHSVDHSKFHTSSKTSSDDTTKTNTTHSKFKPVKTEADKSLLEKKRYSVKEYEQSVPKTDTTEKSYVKQRKNSLESLADSYRLRDQEDRSNRQFNSSLLKDVIGKLENKISKSIEDNTIPKPKASKTLEDRPSKPTSRILISRANSESSLLKKVKDTDNKSKEKAVKQLKDTQNLSKLQNKVKSKDILESEIGKTTVNSLENQNSLNESKLDTTSKQNIERLSPIIPWLEEKKKSSPTPNELDKLMSTMDIENAFSQILDAVEKCPEGTSTSEPSTPDIPIVPIVEEEHSCDSGASGLESANEEVNENKNNEDKSEAELVNIENDNTENTTVEQNEMVDEVQHVTKVSENTETVDMNKNMSNNTAETNGAIKSNSGITKKSEGRLKLILVFSE